MSEDNSKEDKIESTSESLLETVSDAEVNSRISFELVMMYSLDLLLENGYVIIILYS